MRQERSSLFLIVGILFLNIFTLTCFVGEDFSESKGSIPAILRGIGLSGFRMNYFHQIPRLLSSSQNDQTNLSYSNRIHFSQSQYSVPGWIDTRWQYRINITIQASQIPGDLTDYPFLVDIFSTDLFNNVQVDGGDIFFTDSTGNKLDHEIELINWHYSSTQVHLVAWTRIPSLSSTVNTDISMYYGNPTAVNQENPEGVWDSDYLMVQHLEETSGMSEDSTSNNYDGVAQNGVIQDISGKIGGGASFDGIDDVIIGTTPHSYSYDDFTLSAIYKSAEYFLVDDQYIFSHQHDYTETGIVLAVSDDSYPDRAPARVSIYNDSNVGGMYDGVINMTDQQYHHIVGVRDNDQIHIYIDGVLDRTRTSIFTGQTINVNSGEILIGDHPGDTEQVHGILDEIRLSTVARSADWARTNYENIFNPGNFYIISPKESSPVSINWVQQSFRYRKTITVDASQVSGVGTLSNFPLLLNLSDADLADMSKVQSDGADILFTDTLGTKFDYEIEYFDQTGNGTHAQLVAWVKIPSLSGTSDTNITMYYGNNAVQNQDNPSSVWSNNYVSVWHLSEDPSGVSPQILDSTSNSFDGTSVGGMTGSDLVSGQIHQSLDFDGSDDYINVGTPSSLKLTSAFTIEGWYNGMTDTSLDDRAPIYMNGFSWSGNIGIRVEGFHDSVDKRARITYGNGTGVSSIESDNNIAENTWTHLVTTYDGTTIKLFINGIKQINEETGTIAYNTDAATIGGSLENSEHRFNGSLDEIRISSVARSADWILTEYRNQNDTTTFYSISDEEEYPRWWADATFTNRKDIIIDKNRVGGSTEILVLKPNGVGYSSMLSVSGATENWDAVNDVNYDTTTYVHYNLGTWGSDFYGTENAQAELSDTVINSVTIKFRGIFAQGTVGVEGRAQVRTYSSFYSSDAYALGTAYTNIYSKKYQLNPYTGLTWTWSEVNDMEIGVGIHGVLIGDEARV
ncbi:MAG: DUF2341 domain-containing protein, partial [Promethearchaeota archaeon]